MIELSKRNNLQIKIHVLKGRIVSANRNLFAFSGRDITLLTGGREPLWGVNREKERKRVVLSSPPEISLYPKVRDEVLE